MAEDAPSEPPRDVRNEKTGSPSPSANPPSPSGENAPTDAPPRVERFRLREAHGGEVLMVTVTLRHHKCHSLAKMGLGREVAEIQQKEGRNGNLTPFQLLEKWAYQSDHDARRRWKEWTEVMHGRVQIFWS